MTYSLLISDLHLCSERPQINTVFFTFLQQQAPGARALYILGDLFEYWVGDDDDSELAAAVQDGLAKLARGGTALYYMHGNRDFLTGRGFCARSGARLLDDPTLLDLHGTPTLLMHGDTLCTGDTSYQEFRIKVRQPEWQQTFLAQPLAQRRRIAGGLREESTREKQIKSEAIMDVASGAVESVLREHRYPRLIHGHTHRPALHRHTVDGRTCERWVLADWYRGGSYLCCDASGCRSMEIPG